MSVDLATMLDAILNHYASRAYDGTLGLGEDLKPTELSAACMVLVPLLEEPAPIPDLAMESSACLCSSVFCVRDTLLPFWTLSTYTCIVKEQLIWHGLIARQTNRRIQGH